MDIVVIKFYTSYEFLLNEMSPFLIFVFNCSLYFESNEMCLYEKTNVVTVSHLWSICLLVKLLTLHKDEQNPLWDFS